MIRITTAALALAAGPAFADAHLPATGDAEAGEAAFRQCQSCHVVVNEEGETLAGRAAKTGPNLYGIAGNLAGQVEDFRYSDIIVLAGEQGALMAQTPLTLAETASVFGEMLTFRSLLDQTTAPRERKAMLAAKVEDMLNTVVRQIAFYTFERRVHETRRDGELTAERIGEIWLAVQKESLGPAIEFGPGYETFWCYVPHFIHSPFYVYAYAFGDCLVNSLYAVYREAEDGFQQRYFDMLRAGGSKHHSELLAPFGLDASDPDFWGRGLAVISGLIDELEEADAA